jgi:hypothetical protein
MSVAPFLYQRAQQVGVLAYHIEVNGTRCGTTNGTTSTAEFVCCLLLEASSYSVFICVIVLNPWQHRVDKLRRGVIRPLLIAAILFWSTERY